MAVEDAGEVAGVRDDERVQHVVMQWFVLAINISSDAHTERAQVMLGFSVCVGVTCFFSFSDAQWAVVFQTTSPSVVCGNQEIRLL